MTTAFEAHSNEQRNALLHGHAGGRANPLAGAPTSGSAVSARARFFRHLGSNSGLAGIALLALLLSCGSLSAGFAADDHYAVAVFRSGGSPFDLFQMRPADVRRMRETGELAWWVSPELSIRFLRPLASLSHALDFRLWGENPAAMRLTNSIVYALLVVVAALAFRRLLAPATAGLAALMFAVNEGNGLAVGWISGRNTLLCALFSMLALWLHLRQRDRNLAGAMVSAACVALALLSGEFGLASFAYIAAHALVFGPGPLHRRLVAIAPHLVVVLAWGSLYVAGHFGVHGANFYRDPVADPVGTITQALADVPLWLFGQFGLSIIDLGLVFPSWQSRSVALLLVLPLLGWMLPCLRDSREARFFALGMAFCIAPLGMTVPQDRLLLAASFGGFGWLAHGIQVSYQRPGRWTNAGRRVLFTMHLGVAPLAFVPAQFALSSSEGAVEAVADALPRAPGHTTIFVNLPCDMLILVGSLVHRETHASSPGPLRLLYAGGSEFTLERPDARTLTLDVPDGFGSTSAESIFGVVRGLSAGSDVHVSGMTATVLETTRTGAPRRVRYRFDAALEDPSLGWRSWQSGQPLIWVPPAIGASVRVPALSKVDMQ